MPEGVGYGPQNTASTGLNLNVIGKHAYGYNAASVGNETLSALDFTSGNYYAIAEVMFNYNSTGFSQGERIGYQISLNGTMVANAVYGDTQSPLDKPQQTKILIPPYTQVNVSWVNSDSSGIACTMGIVAQIYGKVDE